MVTPRSCSQHVSAQEPQKLVQDGLQMELLRGEEGKARFQAETQLSSEYGQRAGSVRSVLCAPRSSTSATRSRYCCSPRLSGMAYPDLGDDFRRALEAVGGFLGQQAVEERLVHGKQIRKLRRGAFTCMAMTSAEFAPS